ncbi:hypothetical protein PTI98_010526 [Pleurotus ostreatus]|nr:hypothetical protein PTI98_010526 [Pleurotus ostreatus]
MTTLCLRLMWNDSLAAVPSVDLNYEEVVTYESTQYGFFLLIVRNKELPGQRMKAVQFECHEEYPILINVLLPIRHPYPSLGGKLLNITTSPLLSHASFMPTWY